MQHLSLAEADGQTEGLRCLRELILLNTICMSGCCPCVPGGHSRSQIGLLESFGVGTLSLHSDARNQRGSRPGSI